MDIIGVDVNPSLARQASTLFVEFFSTLHPHWKRELCDKAVCLLVSKDSDKVDRSMSSADYCFILTVDDKDVSVDEVVTELTLVYFGTLVNIDPVVARVFSDLVQGFGVAREDALSALVFWVVSPEDAHLYIEPNLVVFCEQMDRELRGLHVPPVACGLTVQ